MKLLKTIIIFYNIIIISCSQDFSTSMRELSQPPQPALPELNASSNRDEPAVINLEWDVDPHADKYILYRTFPDVDVADDILCELVSLERRFSTDEDIPEELEDSITFSEGKLRFTDSPEFQIEFPAETDSFERVLYYLEKRSDDYPENTYLSSAVLARNYYEPLPGTPSYEGLSAVSSNELPGEIHLKWKKDSNTDEYILYRCFPDSPLSSEREIICSFKEDETLPDIISLSGDIYSFQDTPDYQCPEPEFALSGERVVYELEKKTANYPGNSYSTPRITAQNYYPQRPGSVQLHVEHFKVSQRAFLWWEFQENFQTIQIYRMKDTGLGNPEEDPLLPSSRYELCFESNIQSGNITELSEEPDALMKEGLYLFDGRLYFLDNPRICDQLYYYKIVLVNSLNNMVYRTVPGIRDYAYAYVVNYFDDGSKNECEKNDSAENATEIDSNILSGTTVWFQPMDNLLSYSPAVIQDPDWFSIRTSRGGSITLHLQEIYSDYINPSASGPPDSRDLDDVFVVHTENSSPQILAEKINGSFTLKDEGEVDGIVKVAFSLNGYPDGMNAGDLCLVHYVFEDVTFDE